MCIYIIDFSKSIQHQCQELKYRGTVETCKNCQCITTWNPHPTCCNPGDRKSPLSRGYAIFISG